MKRHGSASWTGGLRDGGGSISTESGALHEYPFAFLTRFGDQPGTNPEELIGAAHAGCFTMSFTRGLGEAGFTPGRLDTRSEVTLEKSGEGFAITAVHLSVVAAVPGIDEARFQELAAKAKAGCPVSRLMNTSITFDAKLVS